MRSRAKGLRTGFAEGPAKNYGVYHPLFGFKQKKELPSHQVPAPLPVHQVHQVQNAGRQDTNDQQRGEAAAMCPGGGLERDRRRPQGGQCLLFVCC